MQLRLALFFILSSGLFATAAMAQSDNLSSGVIKQKRNQHACGTGTSIPTLPDGAPRPDPDQRENDKVTPNFEYVSTTSRQVIAQDRDGPRDIHACGNAGDISMPLDKDGFPPKIYSLSPFTPLSVADTPLTHFVALAVYKAGDYKIAINSKLGSELIRLEQIDRNRATNLFGNSTSETQCKYNLISWHKGEPDIFHLELEFNESGLLSRYKVRGIGITDEKWLSI